jgi:hypothetical protein
MRGARGDRAEPEGGPVGANAVERFDPEGCDIPEGEWRLRGSRLSEAGNRQRAEAKKRPVRGEPSQPQSGKPNRDARSAQDFTVYNCERAKV